MSKALAWIRKSKGSEDDIGLQKQREDVVDYAKELAEEVEVLDLGVHTGFSSMTREDGSEALDRNPQVQEAIRNIRNGEYDYLVAYDDRRICRDDYLTIIEYACQEGDVKIEYVADVEEDDLTFDIHRRIERETKEEEIQKAKSALERRRECGYDEGRPKWGTQYDSDGAYLEPDPNTFKDALLAINMAESTNPEFSYREILDCTEINSTGTLKNILDHRDWYFELASRHGIEPPESSVEYTKSR